MTTANHNHFYFPYLLSYKFNVKLLKTKKASATLHYLVFVSSDRTSVLLHMHMLERNSVNMFKTIGKNCRNG